jgi:haloalkane dehalogenase
LRYEEPDRRATAAEQHAERLSRAAVLDAQMSYIDEGGGDPIVLLHGNPTSSFLWRDVIPALVPSGRVVAPDLIGMGASTKIDPSGPDTYRFVEHRRHLDAFLETVGATERVVLVGHDWGSALAFDWANRHRDAVRGIVFMEALVRPLTWQDWPESARRIFRAMRSGAGEEICLEKNVFVERILPSSILRDLDGEEMAAYRAPYLAPGESRRPTLTWPRELPIEGDPADVHEIVAGYAAWLSEAEVPKLLIRAEPGFLTPIADRTCADWPALRTATVPGIHFLQEDSGPQIGALVADWLRELR